MPVAPRRAVARLDALVRADPVGFRAGFVALLIGSGTGLVAGLTLGSIHDTLERLPGLLVLVPAAIGMRGSVYGALGSRLGTAIHVGTFSLTRRRDSLLGQNAAASLALSLAISLVLAVLADVATVAFNVGDAISIADFVVVSVVGGLLSSLVVLVITIGVAAISARRDWDLDNVSAPIVTSAGDVITLPALFIATYLTEIRIVTPVVATACAAAGVVALVASWSSRRDLLRTIVRESFPILVIAGALDTVAGVTVEGQVEALVTLPVFLVAIPPFLGLSGSLGGILASRIGTKLHLGLVDPRRRSLRPVADDVLLVVLYAIPVYALLGLSSHVVGSVVGLDSPGWLDMVEVVVLAGVLTLAVIVLVAFFSETFAHRMGLDPDNFGIPTVTSTLDLGGAFAFVLALTVLGHL